MFCSVYLPQPSQLSNLGATLRLGFILMQFLICAFFSTEMFEEKHIALLLLLRTTLIHAKVGQIRLFSSLTALYFCRHLFLVNKLTSNHEICNIDQRAEHLGDP